MLGLNVDPAVLEEQLASARADRDQLDRVIAWLEDGVEIFAGAPAPAELVVPDDQAEQDTINAGGGSAPAEPDAPQPSAPPPPAPDAPIRPTAPRPPMRAGARDVEAKVLGVILKSNRPVAFAEIRVGRVVFRDTVLKAIAADPGCLTADRIALALDANIDDVTEACDWLVEHHQAQLLDDGTYSRSAPRRARLRAAA